MYNFLKKSFPPSENHDTDDTDDIDNTNDTDDTNDTNDINDTNDTNDTNAGFLPGFLWQVRIKQKWQIFKKWQNLHTARETFEEGFCG